MGVVGILSSIFLANADSANISFQSKKIPGDDNWVGRDVIVYVVNNSGAFVRTIAVWGKKIVDLNDNLPWKTVSDSNVVDATSSATVTGSSANLTANWDGKDKNKAVVASGIYWLIISQTSIDFDPAPPTLKIKLDVGGVSKTITNADSSLNSGSTYLTNLNIAYTGSTKVISQTVSGNQLLVKIGNSKIYVPFNNEKTINVSFFSLNGARLMQQTIPVKSNGEISNVPAAFQTPGTYICRITSKSTIVSKKIAF
jgi:hypothetical protein